MPQPRRRKSRTGTWRWTTLGGRRRTRATRPAQQARTPPPPPSGRRPLNAQERRAGVDFTTLERAIEDGIARLLTAWGPVRAAQLDDLARQIVAAGSDPVKTAAIEAPILGGADLLAELRPVTEAGVATALAEAAAQGQTLPVPVAADVEALLAARADATAALLARSLSEAAARKAVSLASPAIPAARVATEVRTHIDGLSDRWLQDQFNGALAGGMNTGRIVVMAAVEAPARYYISALLDRATCSVCAAFDGRQYDTLAALQEQLPTGGNKDCLGSVRCRCTGVLVMDESPATVQ